MSVRRTLQLREMGLVVPNGDYADALQMRATVDERPLWADHVDLLNQYRLQHIIGVQFQHTAPEWRLEDVVHMLAVSHFTGLGN